MNLVAAGLARRLFHYPPEACGKRSAALFQDIGGALVHRLPREILQKRDSHRTSTKFRLGVIVRVHELFKRPSYVSLIRRYICISYAMIFNTGLQVSLICKHICISYAMIFNTGLQVSLICKHI
jgi:hypothetical protein